MAAPLPYSRLNAYTDWSAANPEAPHPGQDFDEDFDALSTWTAELLAHQALLEREDGGLAAGVIDSEAQFDQAFLTEFRASIANIGLSGIQGPAGPQGVTGPIGTPGPQGPPLPWIVSTGYPSQNIGITSQLFLNADNGDVYQKNQAGWLLLTNIRGPSGTGSGGGVSDHGALTGLSDPDHPIAAVQGLQGYLDALEAAIVGVAQGRSNSYRQPLPPTANLNTGDTWFDSDDGDRFYRWDGTQWVDVSDQRIDQVFADAAAAIAAAAGAQATADGKVTTFFSSTTPTNPHTGDLWIRTDQGNKLYRYSATPTPTWTAVQDSGIQQAILAASNAQDTADGKVVTYFQPSSPIGASLGDLWFDTDEQNHQYRFNGAQWVSVRDAAIAAAAANAAAAIAAAAQAQSDVAVIADGVVEVFYQATAPTGASLGDLWINTSLGNQLTRYDGAQWVAVPDAALQTALTNASLAQATADGKIKAFYQTTPPSGAQSPATGDLWYDTDDTYRPYRYTGSAWQDLSYINGVVNGLVTGVSIQNGTITADKLLVTTLSSIAANIGTVTAGVVQSTNGLVKFDLNNARITLNNGVVMKVQGSGFGTSNQFLEWTGPALSDVSLCSESNATSYMKTDGSAYFGGSLIAGTLTAAIATGDLSATAQTTLGPFGTNGNPIQVVLGYSAWGLDYIGGNTSGQSFPTTATVQLYRKIGAGSETLVGTLNVNGACVHGRYILENGDPHDHTTEVIMNMTGSLTFTDSAGGTDNRTYRAVITGRTLHTGHAFSQQRLSITSTEQ